MEHKFLVINFYGMTGVAASLVAYDIIRFLGYIIGYFAFALVSPLCSYYY